MFKKLGLILILIVVVVTLFTCALLFPPEGVPNVLAESFQPIQETDFITWNETSGRIEFKYDINNSDYYIELVPPPIAECTLLQQEWDCQSGDPSIMYYPPNGTYYVSWRDKITTVRDHRMRHIAIESSQDLVNWTTVWNYHKDDIQQLTVQSIERSQLRYYGDHMYLFFAYDSSGGTWNNSYVDADAGDFVQLGWNLTNASTWHNISYPGIPPATNPGKINFVGSWEGGYYQVKDRGVGAGEVSPWYQLLNTTSINGSWSNTSKILNCYTDVYPNFVALSVNLITYDPTSDLFIAWGHARHTVGTTESHYWWWGTSPDLSSWTFRHRLLTASKAPLPPGWRRMPDLSIVEDGFDRHIVLVEQWDHNGDVYDSIILHHFEEDIVDAWRYPNRLYRIPITINSSMVSGGLTNFPVLITNVSSGYDNFWTEVNSSGSDITLTDIDGNHLDRELVSFCTSTREMELWVNVTAIDQYLDTGIYLYYGCLSCTVTPTPTPSATPATPPGDANGDWLIDAGDITALERMILEGPPFPPSADANGDGDVNAADIGVVEYIILEIWPWDHVHIEASDNLPNGSDFTATAYITYVEEFGSTSFEVSYSSSVLDLEGVSGGRLLEIDPGVSADFYAVSIDGWSQPGGPGTLLVNASVDGNPGPDGSGYLAKLHFHVIGSAGQTSPIAFNVPQSWLKDNVGGVINATWEDDSVTVAP